MNTEILFKEQQRFTQWWIWAPLFSILAYMYYPFLESKPVDKITVCLIIFLAILFFVWRLKTEIDADEIRLHLFPFYKKVIKWSDVQSAEVVNYGFIGGWGIRHSPKYGWVYNIRGNKGLSLRFKNGKNFLIGTQRETELTEIIKRLRPKR